MMCSSTRSYRGRSHQQAAPTQSHSVDGRARCHRAGEWPPGDREAGRRRPPSRRSLAERPAGHQGPLRERAQSNTGSTGQGRWAIGVGRAIKCSRTWSSVQGHQSRDPLRNTSYAKDRAHGGSRYGEMANVASAPAAVNSAVAHRPSRQPRSAGLGATAVRYGSGNGTVCGRSGEELHSCAKARSTGNRFTALVSSSAVTRCSLCC